MQNSQLAILFPGQGSQSLGMLSELAAEFPQISQTFAEASKRLGYDLWYLVQQGPEEQLNETEYTQPALLAASVALFRVWRAMGGELPGFLAGHSLGEYSALVCAEALDYADAIALVALRGRFMQEAVKKGEGAMAAIIGLEDAAIAMVCEQASEGQVLAPANFNAIGQTVLAGEAAAVDRAVVLAKQIGAKLAKQIPVSVPSHCQLMQPAAERLAEYLEKVSIAKPNIPVVSNVDVICYEDADEIRSALVRQLAKPVRWVETIRYLSQQGVQRAIECGPGKVLAGLTKRIVADLTTVSIATAEGLREGLEVVVL